MKGHGEINYSQQVGRGTSGKKCCSKQLNEVVNYTQKPEIIEFHKSWSTGHMQRMSSAWVRKLSPASTCHVTSCFKFHDGAIRAGNDQRKQITSLRDKTRLPQITLGVQMPALKEQMLALYEHHI